MKQQIWTDIDKIESRSDTEEESDRIGNTAVIKDK